MSPTASGAGAILASPGREFAYQVRANYRPTSYAAAGLPLGLSIDADTGLVSGTPAGIRLSNNATRQVTISATNPFGTTSATLSLSFAFPATQPFIVPVQDTASGAFDRHFSYQIRTASAGNITTLVYVARTYTAYGLPPGLTVDRATGVISGHPTQVGTFPVALGATTTSGTSTALLTLRVLAEAPVVSVEPGPPVAVPLATAATAPAATFVLTRTGDLSEDLTVNYTLAGTAVNGTDYRLLTGVKTIRAGRQHARIAVKARVRFDGATQQKSVRLTLQRGNDYRVDRPATATVTIPAATDE